MVNKKGVVGKIILIIFLVVLIFVLITGYQAYELVNSINFQKTEIEKEIVFLKQGDCSKISSIETRILILENKARSACKNPIIYFYSENYLEKTYRCSNIDSLMSEVEKQLKLPKELCDIKILNNFTQEKINEFLENITLENYQEEAKKNNISLDGYSQEEIKQILIQYGK
jgi:hypothetical protein